MFINTYIINTLFKIIKLERHSNNKISWDMKIHLYYVLTVQLDLKIIDFLTACNKSSSLSLQSEKEEFDCESSIDTEINC